MSSEKDQKIKKQSTNFPFNKAQMLIHLAFIAANAYLAFFQVMPKQLQKHPPSKDRLKQSFLTPLINRERDAHDEQWQAFRSNLIVMLFVMFAWNYIVSAFFTQKNRDKIMRSMWLGLGLLIFTFRADVLLYFGVILGWFFMTKYLCKTKIIVPLSWAVVIVILYLNEQWDHLRFMSKWCEEYIVPDWFQFMKNSEAPLLWTNILNMQFLKMLSFTLDSHWGYSQQNFQKHKSKCSECNQKQLCYKGRDLCKVPALTLKNYLDYMLFAPTVLAGPPISYTSFFTFVEYPATKSPPYFRTFFLIIFFEIYSHFYPVILPSPEQSLLSMAFCSLLFLYFISLKFTVIWRVGRLWSLLYGVDVIDNMGRCMFNNYGFQKFWRMWHKGFNHWLIRYLYVPMGGNKNYFSVLFVILFVAFWHDHTIKILAWALILVLFMIPQLAVKHIFRKYYSHLFKFYWFKYLCAFACSFYIQIICYCNLIGFGYGLENSKMVLLQMRQEWLSFIYMTVVVASASLLMFYVREIQKPKRND